jgi:single-stranded-DNA-specific exonuclease
MIRSAHEKIWQQKNINEYYVQELCRKFDISDLLARILSSRVDTVAAAEYFLFAKIKYLLPDPFHLLDMEKAVQRTIEAIINKQQICIFADYDVDGATSSALLKKLFRELGHIAEIYVPDRITEGYGPSPVAMQKIKDSGTILVITVDCGSMAHDALKYAKDVGLEVIVIDHHISTCSLPEAIAVVNPNRIDEISQYKDLAAVGVSFLFACALVSELKKQNYFANNPLPNLMQYLDLVALGTVCDVMPITKLNRAFVMQGLKVILQRQNIGVKALCDIAGLNEKLSCYHLGFALGPRINAGGRVGKSNLGANLLSTLLESEAAILAEELDKHNNERKVIELIILEEAMEIAEAQKNESFLFVAREGWHPGVIGIIASRLKEKFNKPVAVIALDGEVGKASCRSIKGIDFGSKIIEAQTKNLIIVGGGHAMAAGFTAEKDKLPELQKFFGFLFERDFKELLSYAEEEYDLELTTSSVNQEFISELEKLEPYGNGNPEPLFKFSDLFVLKADAIKNKHIQCLLAPCRETYGSKAISAIAFNAIPGPLEKILLNPKPYTISVIGTLKANSWQNKQRIQLQIKDLIVCEPN